MRKLSEVEDAKKLMTDAADWSVLKWLWEKKTVREAADKANAALDQWEQKVKARWREELRSAFKELDAQTGKAAKRGQKQAHSEQPQAIDPEVRLFVNKVKQADGKAYRARMDAEKTFDQAERLLSTSLAREGCQKAIQSWDLQERAIRQAEAGIASTQAKT
jgi:hypothetical protein